MENVRVRFPPSPTGYCHVGTARMAILNYLFAKGNSGQIFFRSEDTDKERSRREFEDDIKEQLQWLGLSWDHFSRSSELVANHTVAMQKLVAEDKAYLSIEESKKERGTTVQVVRLRNPGSIVTFNDVIRGEITFDTTELKDFVIGRALDDPLYNFAVVVDDAAQEITHVIRGEDHISNTPRQILIQEALGYPRPVYAHFPLHLSAARAKLSKRTGDVAVRSYREKGYLAPALLNYLAILGWTPPSGKEVLSLEEMIAEFDLKDLHKSGAVFDVEKLRWYNRQYLLKMSDEEFASYVLPILEEEIKSRNLSWNEHVAKQLVLVLKDHTAVTEDLREGVRIGEWDFWFNDPSPKPALIPDKKSDATAARKHLQTIMKIFSAAETEDFSDSERIKNMVWEYATATGRGAVLWPFRYALSGLERSPDPFVISTLIGKEATLRRLQTAITILTV